MTRRTAKPAGDRGETWSRATVLGVMIVAAAVVFLALVPDWLVQNDFAGSRLLRDLTVTIWATVGFVVLSWLVVRFQRGPRR